MFTVEQRDALRDHLLRLAEKDEHVVAGAAVGSLAVDGGAGRDHALSLACLRQGLPAIQARGYDDLSAETLARFEAAHVGAVEPRALRAALAASVLALIREGAEARLPHTDSVAQRLAELSRRG